jgi:MYXO-CTERM domain-containing protein
VLVACGAQGLARMHPQQRGHVLGRGPKPLEVASDHASLYRERIAKNLVFFDGIDGHTGRQHQTCGGRRPTDDIMDVLFGLYAGGFDGPPITDGVEHPSQAISDKFPYLAPPDTSPQSGIKTAVLGSSGCGCHGTKGKGESGGGAALMMVAIGLGLRRRRRSRSRTAPTRGQDQRRNDP